MGLIIASSHKSYKSLSSQNIFFVTVGAVLYGFTFAVNGIEGQTVVFVIPAALCGVFYTFRMRWKEFQWNGKNPVALFFLVAYMVSLILFVYWGIRYSGFPEFSALGWI